MIAKTMTSKNSEQALPNPFRTLTKEGRPVTDRFSSVVSLLDVYKTLQRQDEAGEAKRRGKIRGMYEGKRPWDPAKQEAAGIKGMANVNCGGLAGQVDARAGAVNDMALDTTNLVELRAVQAEVAGPDAEFIADVISEEFSSVLREGRRFLPAVATMVRETDLYGLGPITWRDPFDYQPVALERGQVKFPDDSSSISSENDLIMVESTLPAWYLIQLFDDTDASSKAGWNLNAVKRYLVGIFCQGLETTSQSQDETGTSVYESVLAQMRQNRVFEVRQFETIRVVNAFVREVSGARKITHYMAPTVGDPDDFLFVRKDAYDTMDQCLIWLPYSATERYARGLRGMASKLLPFEDLRNRTFCKIVDAAAAASSIKLESTTHGEGLRNTIVEQGPYTLYTGSVKPVNSRSDPDFQQLASVNEMISRVSTNNALGASGPAAAPERIYSGADRKTKDQVQMEASAGAKSEQALFVLRSMVFDALFRECFRRFMILALDANRRDKYEGVKSFVRKCEMRGVTLDHLRRVPELFSIYMCRDLVTGGAGAKAGILFDVLQIGGNLDEAGRVNVTHDYIRCRAGTKAADRYRPRVGRDSLPSDSASHAMLENNDMAELAAVLVGSEQLHWSHIPVHSQLLTQIVDAVKNGQVEDPQKMLGTMQLVSEHVQRHIELGGRQIGKEDDAKAAMAALRGLRPVVQALTMMAETKQHEQEAEAEKAQAQQADLEKRAEGQEAAAAMHDSDNKAAVKMYEVDKMHEARMADAGSKAQAEAFKARSKAEIERISARYRALTEGSKITGGQPPSMDQLEGTESLALPNGI